VAIAEHGSLSLILAAKAEMIHSLKQNLGLMLKVQGIVTLSLVVFAPELVDILHISWLSVFVFRAGAIGALLHMLHLGALIVLLYLDFQLEAAGLAVTFLATNAGFTLISLRLGWQSYGFGYALASAVTLCTALWLLSRAFRRFEYHIFMRQPLS
jgi:uncharacterized membrane protein